MTREPQDTPQDEAPLNRLRFLLIAGVLLAFALLDYLVMGTLRFVETSGILTALYTVLAFLLLIFVVAALVSLACYGNRRLAREVSRRAQYLRDAWGVPMRYLGLGGFRVESASDEARMASRRVRLRQERRRYARQHREKGD